MPAHAGRRLAALGVSVAALTAVSPLSYADARPALSCTAPSTPGGFEQWQFEQADVVFSGRVIAQRVKRIARYSPDGLGVSYSGTITYRVKPDRVYKGYVRSPQRVRAGGPGDPGEYRLRSKDRYLFFATRPSAEEAAKFKERGTRPPLYAGPCSGTRRLDRREVPFGTGRPVGKS